MLILKGSVAQLVLLYRAELLKMQPFVFNSENADSVQLVKSVFSDFQKSGAMLRNKNNNFGGDLIMVFEKVKSIIMDQLDVEEDKVALDAVIQDDLGADSLDIVDLVMSFEEEFDIEIPDDQVENIKTVGDIVKYIEDHID